MPVGLTMQQAPVWPCGQLAVAQAVPLPLYSPLPAAQAAAVVTAQCPSGKQHAPVSGAQVSVPHSVPSPRYTPLCEAQSAGLITWQMIAPPEAKQQAPMCGCGQLAATQNVPFPRNTPPAAAHWADVVAAQCPSGKQHAPVSGAQFVFVQVVPSPR